MLHNLKQGMFEATAKYMLSVAAIQAHDMYIADDQLHATRCRMDLKPLASHGHAMEGFAMDWSAVKAGRLATGDCKKNVYVWEPSEGGRWSVGGAYAGERATGVALVCLCACVCGGVRGTCNLLPACRRLGRLGQRQRQRQREQLTD
jgi:hypothetical protein